jgi:hypothetical protein
MSNIVPKVTDYFQKYKYFPHKKGEKEKGERHRHRILEINLVKILYSLLKL